MHRSRLRQGRWAYRVCLRFGDKPVGGEADGGAHIGADMGGEGFLNGEGFGFGNFRGLLWGVFRTFVDRENRFDVDVVNEGFDPFVE